MQKFPSTWKYRSFVVLLCLVAVALGGCGATHDGDDDLASRRSGDNRTEVNCGKGDMLVSTQQALCVYRKEIIEEGFECPQDLSVMRTYGDLVICSEDPHHDDEVFDALHDEYDPVLLPEESSPCMRITCESGEACADGSCHAHDSPTLCVANNCGADAACPPVDEQICAVDGRLYCSECALECHGLVASETRVVCGYTDRSNPTDDEIDHSDTYKSDEPDAIINDIADTVPNQVAAGDSHTCALVENGAVKCWGDNTYGQLGDGTTTPSSSPVFVSSVTNAVQIAVGYQHTCVVLATGSVQCWGRNNTGQLGDNSTIDKSSPVFVKDINNAVQVSASGRATLHDGSYTCALLDTGDVKCWGYNYNTQLGDRTAAIRTVPVLVERLSNAVQIDAGPYHACAVVETGRVKCWGRNDAGRLGDHTRMYQEYPVEVLHLNRATQVVAARSHTCVLLETGKVFCWGENKFGQLGNNSFAHSKALVEVQNLTDVIHIAADWHHTCAVLSDGQSKCWGSNESGQLGDNANTDARTPVAVQNLNDVVQITTGTSHTCAKRQTGELLCWGQNTHGQLGNATLVDNASPVSVVDL